MTAVADTATLFHASHILAYGEHNRMFKDPNRRFRKYQWICRCVRCGASAQGIDQYNSEHDSALESLCPHPDYRPRPRGLP